MGADRGYTGLTILNPAAPTRQLMIRWSRRRPYALDELRVFVPRGWRMPTTGELITAVGRNHWLFEDGTRWRAGNRRLDVLDHLVALNETLAVPLGLNEVEGIARCVQKHWERHGDVHTGKWLEKQHGRGQKSGQARRAAEAPRDREIRLLNHAEWSVREIAQELSVPKSVVHYVVALDPWVQLPFEALDTVPPPPSQVQRLKRARTVFDLHAQGLSVREIARILNLSRDIVRRDILRFSDPG